MYITNSEGSSLILFTLFCFLQNKVTAAVNHFVHATEMVNSLALFSRNEELSEVPTSELR